MAAELQFRKADLYFSLKDYEKAIGEYQQLLKRYSQYKSSLGSWYWVGESYLAMKEFDKAINRELDYTIEAQNMIRFRHNFERDKTVYAPKVYRELPRFSYRTFLA